VSKLPNPDEAIIDRQGRMSNYWRRYFQEHSGETVNLTQIVQQIQQTVQNPPTQVGTVIGLDGIVVTGNLSSQLVISFPGGGGAGLALSDTAPDNTAKTPFWVDTTDGTLYIWYDDGTSAQWVVFGSAGGGSAANLITYDNTSSGLTADDVQAAIDELAASGGGGGTWGSITGTLSAQTDLQAALDAKTSTTGGMLIQGGAKDLTTALTTSFSVDGILPAGYTITGWELLVYPSGSLTLDVRKGSSIAVTPTSITPSGKPAVSAATNATGGVTGWTSTAFAQSNSITVAVDSVSGVKWFSLLLKGTRTHETRGHRLCRLVGGFDLLQPVQHQDLHSQLDAVQWQHDGRDGEALQRSRQLRQRGHGRRQQPVRRTPVVAQRNPHHRMGVSGRVERHERQPASHHDDCEQGDGDAARRHRSVSSGFSSTRYKTSPRLRHFPSSLLGVPKTIYWRIYGAALSGGTAMSIAEIEFRAFSGGPNLCSGGTASASTNFNSTTFASDKAFDGNTTTSWSASSNTGPLSWIRYDLAAASPVNEVALRARTDSPNQMPSAFAVQSSMDGLLWTDEWAVTGSTGWTAGLQRIFTR
jgi:hypothetical protein